MPERHFEIITGKWNCIASKGTQLLNYAGTLDYLIHESQSEPPTGADALLARIEAFYTMICGGSGTSGANGIDTEETFDVLIAEAETMLGY